MRIEKRLHELGFKLPPAPKPPPGVVVPFKWVRVHGDRAYVAGHGPQLADGSFAGPFGKVGLEVSPEQAYAAAQLAALSILGNLKRALGDLDRISAWLVVSGHVAVAPGFNRTTNILNGCSDLLLEVFGSEIGSHARTAIGIAELPLGAPVVIAAEVAINSGG
jgi:enamine deaminase RidA (YjgF/YER057c/UK114 family)